MIQKPADLTEALANYVESSLQSSKLCDESRSQAVIKPITSPKPLAITVDLSRKSFMPSLLTNQRQELCITVYYNGELTQSRLLRANTFGSNLGPVNDEKCQFYSGRRIDSFIEIPWIVRPYPMSISQEAEIKALGFQERWNRVNKMLMAEADEWGRYGRLRSPMGEYLEEISKRGVPEGARNLSNESGAGIIDVCALR